MRIEKLEGRLPSSEAELAGPSAPQPLNPLAPRPPGTLTPLDSFNPSRRIPTKGIVLVLIKILRLILQALGAEGLRGPDAELQATFNSDPGWQEMAALASTLEGLGG
mmetsp:Transcript_17899/g.27682  ORF Transcript_17899/g.27682 Transcript_17899/m.27682 type:complete len:107 (+) Transcript_17899:380-700(+)